MEGCERLLEFPEVRDELDIWGEVRHRMIDRAVERSGDIMPEN